MLTERSEAGRTGNPACIPTEDLVSRGVRVNGMLQTCSGDDLSPRGLLWLPDQPTQLVEPDTNESAIQTWIEHKSLAEKPRRLTGPIQFILKLLEFWRLETSDAVGLLGFDSTDDTHVAAVLAGNGQFRGRDVKDRISHLFFIRNTLNSLFQDLDTENDWLRGSHSMLDDRLPLSLLLGGSMEDILLVREYVEVAAGR